MPDYPRKPKSNNKAKPSKNLGPNTRNDPEDLYTQMEFFQEFCKKIIPELREDLVNGLSVEQILTKYDRYAAARAVTVIMTEPDSAKALSAAKDILDRSKGKAVERKKIEHSMKDIQEDQLDSLIKSAYQDLDDEDIAQ